MTILIKELSNDEYQVTAKVQNTTNHIVTLTDETHKKLTDGKINKKKLIKFSFEFLLEREPNTSILA